MNWSDVVAAIPAAVVAAVAAAPNGLSTLAQVYVDPDRRDAANAAEAWGRLADDSPELLGPVIGGKLFAWDLELRVGGAAPTDAQLQSWGANLEAYFDGRPLSVTGLVSNTVSRWELEEAPGRGPARELVMTIRFVGINWPFVTTVA